MMKFSKLQIRLHWLTLMLIAITYAAMELRGWFPKGSNTYLLMGNDTNVLISYFH